jgi:serine/threonine protein phosphatase PrpC
MTKTAFEFDVAWALDQGRRTTQEDAIAVEFPTGGEHGIVVLADGLGGHAAGDVASRLVVDEVLGELRSSCAGSLGETSAIPGLLRRAAQNANDCLRRRLETDASVAGMASTLVAMLQIREALYWVSVGDSVIYLYRGGQLSRLNGNHSLAPQIDFLVKNGAIPAEKGDSHPSRSCLTSALTGGEIAEMDCPDLPLVLGVGDIVIVASDGLQGLSEARTGRLLSANRHRSSQAIADALLRAISDLDDPQQDNLSFSVVKVRDGDAEQRAHPPYEALRADPARRQNAKAPVLSRVLQGPLPALLRRFGDLG